MCRGLGCRSTIGWGLYRVKTRPVYIRKRRNEIWTLYFNPMAGGRKHLVRDGQHAGTGPGRPRQRLFLCLDGTTLFGRTHADDAGHAAALATGGRRRRHEIRHRRHLALHAQPGGRGGRSRDARLDHRREFCSWRRHGLSEGRVRDPWRAVQSAGRAARGRHRRYPATLDRRSRQSRRKVFQDRQSWYQSEAEALRRPADLAWRSGSSGGRAGRPARRRLDGSPHGQFRSRRQMRRDVPHGTRRGRIADAGQHAYHPRVLYPRYPSTST